MIAHTDSENEDYSKAIDVFENLIKLNPKNANNFHNLGIVYTKTKKTDLAINNYLKAIEIIPNDSLMLIELAQAQINEESSNNLLNAIKNLKKASLTENQNEKLWYLLSVAYGRNNEMSKSKYASAYSAYLKGDDVRALNFIQKAKKLVKKNSVEWNKLDNLESKRKKIESLKEQIKSNIQKIDEIIDEYNANS